MKKLIFVLSLLSLSFSCGSKTVVPDCPKCQDQTAKSACTELVFSLCGQLARCNSNVEDAVCEQNVLPACAGFDAMESEQITQFYDECITRLDKMSCEEVNTSEGLPQECTKYLEGDARISIK